MLRKDCLESEETISLMDNGPDIVKNVNGFDNFYCAQKNIGDETWKPFGFRRDGLPWIKPLPSPDVPDFPAHALLDALDKSIQVCAIENADSPRIVPYLQENEGKMNALLLIFSVGQIEDLRRVILQLQDQ